MNRTPQLLLIDDDHDDHEIFAEALKIALPDVRCSFVFSCKEAIDLMDSKLIPIPECIFLDWHLPKLQGMACVERLRLIATENTTRLYILTGGPVADQTILNSTMVNGILTKHSTLEEFAKEITSVIS
jgi:DNA-binding response OmpR family regulator